MYNEGYNDKRGIESHLANLQLSICSTVGKAYGRPLGSRYAWGAEGSNGCKPFVPGAEEYLWFMVNGELSQTR